MTIGENIRKLRRERDITQEGLAEMAVHFDTVSPDAVHTSPAVRGLVSGEVWWHDGHNRSHDWLEAMETREAYDFVRDDPAFAEILALLRETAK